jgi:hypothetical protein
MDMKRHIPSPALIAGYSGTYRFRRTAPYMLHMQRTGPFIANLPSANTKIHATYFELQTHVGTVD